MYDRVHKRTQTSTRLYSYTQCTYFHHRQLVQPCNKRIVYILKINAVIQRYILSATPMAYDGMLQHTYTINRVQCT